MAVLVTSRKPLRLRWERTLPLRPLAVPDPRHVLSLQSLAAVPAVTLFLERARAVAPAFELTEENARAVADLCIRLDGLPLAIELVAPRAAQLGVAVALDRLGGRLPIPASPMQDAPARQQSLEATLQWSVDLLEPSEQALFRRAAVFSGGWTLEAAEAIAANLDVPDVLKALLSLADKHLVVAQEQLRFRMLETARELALDVLESSGDADEVRRRHAEFFAAFAEHAEPRPQGATQVAAQQWFRVLLRPTAAAARPSAVRARALNAAGFRATKHAEYAIASDFHDKAAAIWRELDDLPGMVASLHGLGDTALWVGKADRARAHYEEGLELARAKGSGEGYLESNEFV